MNTYLATVLVRDGELEYSEVLLVTAGSDEEAEQAAYQVLERESLSASEEGYFDLGGQIHLRVKSVQIVLSEDIPVLQHYLLGYPRYTNVSAA